MEKWVAKQLFISLFFSGSFGNWRRNHAPNSSPDIVFPFAIALQEELNTIANHLRMANPEFYNTARQTKEAKKEKNYIGSFFAFYLQELETRVVGVVLQWLITETDVMKKKGVDGNVGTYEFDGLKLLTYNVEKYGKDRLIEDMGRVIREKTGYEVEWANCSENDDIYDISKQLKAIEYEEEVKQAPAEVVDAELKALAEEIQYLELPNW